MANWLTDLLGGGAKGIVEGVGSVVDKFVQTSDEKAAFKIKVEEIVTQRMAQISDEVKARFTMVSDIIKAEMASGDNFTRRARPTLVYWGMGIITLSYVIMPMLGKPQIDMPDEFWWAWGGVVGAWIVGRSAERLGVKGPVTRMVTGSTPADNVLEMFKRAA